MFSHILCSFTRGRGWRVVSILQGPISFITVVRRYGVKMLVVPAAVVPRRGQFCDPAKLALLAIHPSSVPRVRIRKRRRAPTGMKIASPDPVAAAQEFRARGRQFLQVAPDLSDTDYLSNMRSLLSHYETSVARTRQQSAQGVAA